METSPAYSIQQLPEQERPRERLMSHGPEALSTAELVAILLGSGTRSTPVLKLAQEIVARFGGPRQIAEATIEELCQIKGVGKAKAIQLKACFSLGCRLAQGERPAKYRIENPLHAYHLIKEELEHEKRELFICLLLDVKNTLISRQIISIGTLTQTLVHPREVFYPAIRHKAAAILLAHNHPSGDPTPSKQDIELTRTLIETGRVIGIPVNDHLIVGEGRFISLRQRELSLPFG